MRTALITGACGGIGRATTEAFASAGWRTVAVDRREPDRALPADEFHRLDVSDEDALESFVRVCDEHGLDCLVNNAAVSDAAPVGSATAQSIAALLSSNLVAPMTLTSMLVPALERTGGCVVNVASVHAVASSAHMSSYAASKGGLVAFTRAAAVELAPLGIRCNAVLPGATDTHMLRSGLGVSGDSSGRTTLEELVGRTPLQRIGRPEEIAEAIMFLADGDRSAFVTGTTLIVDGGVLARLSSE
jgi:NAD(P)-dependent dehydrogenase (short-subunit alcohol dehydrogenase family)